MVSATVPAFWLGTSWRRAGRLPAPAEPEEKRAALAAEGIDAHLFDRDTPLDPAVLDGTTHLLASVPPDRDGDPVVDRHGPDIVALIPKGLRWVGYLSTTGVYGDRDGGWVDENTPVAPDVGRSERRVGAEVAWLALWREPRPAAAYLPPGRYLWPRSQRH